MTDERRATPCATPSLCSRFSWACWSAMWAVRRCHCHSLTLFCARGTHPRRVPSSASSPPQSTCYRRDRGHGQHSHRFLRPLSHGEVGTQNVPTKLAHDIGAAAPRTVVTGADRSSSISRCIGMGGSFCSASAWRRTARPCGCTCTRHLSLHASRGRRLLMNDSG